MEVAALTVLCVDVYEQQNVICVGGNSVNFATQCLKSGVAHASLIGTVGTKVTISIDESARWLEKTLLILQSIKPEKIAIIKT